MQITKVLVKYNLKWGLHLPYGLDLHPPLHGSINGSSMSDTAVMSADVKCEEILDRPLRMKLLESARMSARNHI